MANKTYCIDTNVLLNDFDCINVLRNHEENQIVIPVSVLLELDKLKKDSSKAFIVSKAIDAIIENFDYITFSGIFDEQTNDLKIMNEGIKDNKNTILVSNDKIFRLLCKIRGIESEDYKSANAFKCESEIYGGISEEGQENKILNTFYEKDGELWFHGKDEDKLINYTNKPWNIVPRNKYQNMLSELILNNNIDLVSVEGEAGYGKSYITLACAIQLVLQNTEKQQHRSKKFRKIYVVKEPIEIGTSIGFLPGTAQEKLAPYYKYLDNLISKLHECRKIERIYSKTGEEKNKEELIEVLPISFIRGLTLENCVVIIDEGQNISRVTMRSILTRMGQNVKVVLLGNVNQIDNQYLSRFNNGLTWTVKSFIGEPNYAHMLLKGDKSRGNIADLCLKKGL